LAQEGSNPLKKRLAKGADKKAPLEERGSGRNKKSRGSIFL